MGRFYKTRKKPITERQMKNIIFKIEHPELINLKIGRPRKKRCIKNVQ